MCHKMRIDGFFDMWLSEKYVQKIGVSPLRILDAPMMLDLKKINAR